MHPQMAAAFLSAVIFGLVAHGMGLLNKFSTHDDVMALFSVGTTISSGRWMLHILDWLETIIFGDGHFSLPLTHGLFSILCIALSSCLLVDLLKIRNKACCAGLSGLMVAFPAITGLFGYMYTMPYYLLAMLMMTVSASLICRKTHWAFKVLAVLMGGCSVGIYQAFLPMLLSIPLLYDLFVLSGKEADLKAFFRTAGVQVLCILGVMIFYFAANRFFLAKFQLELNSYMGINQMGTTSLSDYLGRVGRTYAEFFWPERNVAADIFPMHLFYVSRLMVFADVLLSIRLVVRQWKGNRSRALVLMLLLALVPLACNFIYIMSEKVHGLMTYGQVMQAVLFVWLMDGFEIRHRTLQRFFSGLAAAILGLACIMYARFDNQCYMKTAFQQQQAVSWVTALAAQIKATEGFRDDLPVAFLNQEEISDQSLYNIGELDFILLAPYSGDILEYLNSYALRNFMERWCGFGPAYADASAWADLPEVRQMPHYPDDGSIRNLGDVIIVNF